MSPRTAPAQTLQETNITAIVETDIILRSLIDPCATVLMSSIQFQIVPSKDANVSYLILESVLRMILAIAHPSIIQLLESINCNAHLAGIRIQEI